MGTGSSKGSRGLYRTREVSLRSLCSGGCSHSARRRDQNKEDRMVTTVEPDSRGENAVRSSNKSRRQRCIQGENIDAMHIPSTSSGIELNEWVQRSASPIKSFSRGISMGDTDAQSFILSSHSPPQLGQTSGQGAISFNKSMNMGSSTGYSVSSALTAIHEERICTHVQERRDDVLQDGSFCPLLFSRLGYSANPYGADSYASELHLGVPPEVQRPDQVYGNTATHSSVTKYGSDTNGSSILCDVTSHQEHNRACGHTRNMQPPETSRNFNQAMSSERHVACVLGGNAAVGTFSRVEGTSNNGIPGNMMEGFCDCTAESMNQRTQTLQTPSNYDPSSGNCSMISNNSYHQLDVDNPRPLDASNNHPVSWRSAFVEQRQRVRDQVRALQILGSRFESLVGHDRSCNSSVHHQSGQCICRMAFRTDTVEDVRNTRVNISRIVMLAEALFDVLDEIHQQSMVLSSWPSSSVLRTLPAPEEAVENLPSKMYTKFAVKDEEAAQCRICLVEYAEGDMMRILPCKHKFHQTCIDKWLKEIRRVCPLCRGNICKSDHVPSE